jgi:hypothetical protein
MCTAPRPTLALAATWLLLGLVACGGTSSGDAIATDAGIDAPDVAPVPDQRAETEVAGDATPDPAPAEVGPEDTEAPEDVPTADEAQYGAALALGELLGRPTGTSVALNVVPAVAQDLRVAFGVDGGPLDRQTPVVSAPGDLPAVLTLEGLAPDTRYAYQLRWRPAGGGAWLGGPERRFHTARPAGSTFTFTLQADSHLDENSNADTYAATLGNIAADQGDFHVDLGDTFMCEKHSEAFDVTSPPANDDASVDARYRYDRGWFARFAHSVPLFLVNGNHEGEGGWFFDGTPSCVAAWTTKARKAYFLNPVPDGFYTGDPSLQPVVGQRAAWYAWTWGNALFVVLDPYWNTLDKPGKDGWGITLGKDQVDWLAATLADTHAAFRFVFVHNLAGGLDGQMRGGVEAAPYYEWGGKDEDGTDTFATNRPGWPAPIHDLLVQHGVTAVFHGHDHVYVHQELDGIAYQELPQPSATNVNSGPQLAEKYHYASGTILSSPGHLRVTVGPDQARVEYVRAFRAEDETGGRHNGQIDDTYTLAPRAPASR